MSVGEAKKYSDWTDREPRVRRASVAYRSSFSAMIGPVSAKKGVPTRFSGRARNCVWASLVLRWLYAPPRWK